MGKKDVDTGINPNPFPNPNPNVLQQRPPSDLQINMRLDDAIRENARLTEELEAARSQRDDFAKKANHLAEINLELREQLDRSFVIDKSASPSLWFINGGGVPEPSFSPGPIMLRVDQIEDDVSAAFGSDTPRAIRDRAILRGLLSSADAQIRLTEYRASFSPGGYAQTPDGEPPR